jgi:hypothetical protein
MRLPAQLLLLLSTLLLTLSSAQKTDPFQLYLQGFSAAFSFAPSTGISEQTLAYDGRNGGGIGSFSGDYALGGSLSFSASDFTFQELPFNQPNVRRLASFFFLFFFPDFLFLLLFFSFPPFFREEDSDGVGKEE